MAEVTALRGATVKSHDEGVTAEPVLPGVNASITVPMGEKGGGIHLSTMFLRDDPGIEQEKILAKVWSVAHVIGLQEKIIEHKAQLRNAERNLEQCSPDALKKAELTTKLHDARKELPVVRQRQIQEYRDSGRTGEFRPSKAQQSITDRLVKDIDDAERAIKEIEDEFQRKRNELKKAVNNWNVAIKIAEDEIAVRRETYGE